MQEDIEHRSVTLVISASKFTGRTLWRGIKAFLRFSKNKVQQHKNVTPKGKQSVKKLIGQNQGVSNLDIGDDADLKAFDRIARKYGVDYAVKRVETEGNPKFVVFFKARDTDAINTTMEEYANHWKAKGKEERPSVRKTLAYLRSVITGRDDDRAKNKEISR